MFPGMQVLWSGTERQSVAADSPSKGTTLPAPPAHTPWRVVKERWQLGVTEECKCVHKPHMVLLQHWYTCLSMHLIILFSFFKQKCLIFSGLSFSILRIFAAFLSCVTTLQHKP